MTLKQLEYFLELAEDCHFSKVAERLFISQSSLSYSMSELEKDLEVKLFEHQGRRTVLTDTGREYARLVEPVLRSLNEANDAIRAFAGVSGGDVMIGFAQSMFAAAGPEVIRRFYEKPGSAGINIKMSDQKGSYDLKTDLVEGRLDLIFSPINDENLSRVFLFRRPLCLYVPQGHRLSGRSLVQLQEILDEEYISAPEKYPSRQMVDSIFLGEGVHRKVVYEQLTHRGTLNYVTAGLGVAIIPYSPEYDNFEGRAITIDDPRFRIDYYLQWAKNRQLSRAADYVRHFLLEQCRDIWEDLNT